jgi:acyl-CoA thioester hydrolase
MNEAPLTVPRVTTIRVRYAETDKMGVVYHANYLVWFEIGRCELLRGLGSSYRDLEATGIALPVIEAHCEYRQPARYDDELEVKAWGALRSPARIEFHYQVTRPADAVVTARGRTVHAAVDTNGRPCRLPERIRELFR